MDFLKNLEGKSLAEATAYLITRFLDENDKRNVNWLAKKARVSRSTVRRFAQKEGEYINNFEGLIATLAVFTSKNDLTLFIQKYFPEMNCILMDLYSAPRSKFVERDSHLSDILMSEKGGLIYRLCSTNAGSTREHIERLEGENAIMVLDELIEDNYLIEDTNGVIKSTEKEFSLWDSRALLTYQIHSAKRFDKDLIGTIASTIGCLSESVNMDGLAAIKAETISYLKKIGEIKQDPKYDGSIPFFVNVLYGLLDKYNFILPDEGGK